ncbi:uncharacterized protein BDR25DRAFT_364771 [Lindgomyces ingoldianus]|uniref:Uncharacterized protein n=1 Tax=Lindgomyces ingoldianus TaxID=673940 RepID=A0ACB6RGF1_9PLEO|nr:uncharacterized protein BDR25DRAFT_364771 [Lindgomyces ingoldianus]KAF2477805.1 hypothetical protein BDR25DRAFT_364771 [Lindgomyces ingoldianus]
MFNSHPSPAMALMLLSLVVTIVGTTAMPLSPYSHFIRSDVTTPTNPVPLLTRVLAGAVPLGNPAPTLTQPWKVTKTTVPSPNELSNGHNHLYGAGRYHEQKPAGGGRWQRQGIAIVGWGLLCYCAVSVFLFIWLWATGLIDNYFGCLPSVQPTIHVWGLRRGHPQDSSYPHVHSTMASNPLFPHSSNLTAGSDPSPGLQSLGNSTTLVSPYDSRAVPALIPPTAEAWIQMHTGLDRITEQRRRHHEALDVEMRRLGMI